MQSNDMARPLQGDVKRKPMVRTESPPRLRYDEVVRLFEAEAGAVLSERGVIVPEILANAGAVTVSYFDWTQNVQQFRWDMEQVNGELERILAFACRSVRELACEWSLRMRRAACLIAADRVAQAIRLRGFV
jgi:glutamate dehydrogenase/leucine dehydrogenase